jgi:hypothetical protein
VPSLIEQLQRDALNPNVRVSDLLRRMKLAAMKLGLGAVEDWVEQELTGYENLEQIPEYRVIYGRPMARHPFRGWEEIGGDLETLSRRPVGQSVASLEELAKAPDGTLISFPYPDALVKKLNKLNGTHGWPARLDADRSHIVAILDHVRNQILDWALAMEKAGVLGSEINFDKTEKEKAHGATTTINIGTIGAFAGNLGSANVSGNVSLSDVDTKLVHGLTTQLRAHIAELTEAGADGPTLKARLDEIDSEIRKPSPVASVLRGLLVDVRNAISGAAGNLMAAGAVALINQVLGTGVPTPH